MSRQTYPTERLGALSDGVFAIVLTLLVLELKIPDLPGTHTEGQMLADLAERLPNFMAWLISFVLVARFWVVHHDILASLARCHVGTMTWNFVVLAVVSLVPFGSALIGTYEYDPVAVIVFSVVFAMAGLSLAGFARHVEKDRPLHREDRVVDLGRHSRYHARVIPLVAGVSCSLAFVNEILSVVVWLGEPLLAWSVWRRAALRTTSN